MTSRLIGYSAFALICALLISATSLAMARPFHHPFGELREYHRHWLAVCPDKHEPASQSEYRTNCWASTWTGNDDGTFTGGFPGDRLSVHRNRTTGELAITFVSEMVENIDKSRPIHVQFSNGSVSDYSYGASITPNRNSGNEYTFPIKMETEELVKRMKAGSHVTIIMPTKSGDKSMFFSLIGLKSALGFLEKFADR